jgi:glycogen operon protein
MDSLRYWATEMHVDGFRFDLASTLARQLHDVDQLSSFFTLIHQSPDLRDAKLIAEPWDVGAGGYQVGNFPVRWAEWNGRYRDTSRAFWRGDPGLLGDFGYRITGSSDLYEAGGRRPADSINFVTAHDGFTLYDLVSYNHKHNEANGEHNRDGNDNELSYNYGAEGTTENPQILSVRARQQRNLLTTLILAQGTPMLVAGDEYGHSQKGNNNAYCQDNEISWIDWERTPEQEHLREFTKQLLQIRREHPALRRSKFFRGIGAAGTDLHDLLWFRPDGAAMTQHDWENSSTRTVQMFLAGRGVDDVDDDWRPLVDDNLLLLINASVEEVEFKLPVVYKVREPWRLLFDTAEETQAAQNARALNSVKLGGRSCALLMAPSRVVRRTGLHRLGATYRVQLTPQFPLTKARELVDYLQALGITDLYTSPVLAAAKGSSHGYDVVDHTRVNPELGGAPALLMLSQRLREANMGLLIDWVPNHMGVAVGENAWWDDVLENGPSSLYADFFDIDWAPARVDLQNRVLLPILGDQ